MKKKLVSVLLALVMCLALAIPAFAADELATGVTEVEAVSIEESVSPAATCAHTHQVFFTSGAWCESYMSMGHWRVSYVKYRCEDCGAILDPVVTGRSMEDHTLKKIGYTGNNYHKGKLHYLEYEYDCIQCDYITTKWQSCTCPGNPDGTGCVFPINGIKPPLEEK